MNHQDPREQFIRIGPIDPREKGVKVCPSGCAPPMIMSAVPPLKSPMNAIARCLRCGAYWEISPQGIVLNQSQWLTKATVIPEGEGDK